MAQVQYFGVKYPFTSQDEEKYFVDLNKSPRDKVRSELMHVIFTPKGQKIRDPQFGTNLIKFIFEPNDSKTWSEINDEVKTVVNRYVNNVIINNIEILQNEEDRHETLVRIDYGVKEGNIIIDDTVITKL